MLLPSHRCNFFCLPWVLRSIPDISFDAWFKDHRSFYNSHYQPCYHRGAFSIKLSQNSRQIIHLSWLKNYQTTEELALTITAMAPVLLLDCIVLFSFIHLSSGYLIAFLSTKHAKLYKNKNSYIILSYEINQYISTYAEIEDLENRIQMQKKVNNVISSSPNLFAK